jgi:phosphohistidine phosphatase
MKRTLLLMRHAKSSWADTALSDSNRPLNKRGRHDAPVMGNRLNAAGYRCDCMITSPAVRARDTAKAVAKAIGYRDRILKEDALYMADTRDFLRVIAGVDKKVKHLMLVSHNPGTEEFFSYLTGETVAKFPTAAYVLIEIDQKWDALSRGRLLRFDYPKSSG